MIGKLKGIVDSIYDEYLIIVPFWHVNLVFVLQKQSY